MSDAPFDLAPPLAARLTHALDVEGKVAQALEALGPVVGREVALLDAPQSRIAAQLAELGARLLHAPMCRPLRLPFTDSALDAVISLWSGFRGVDAGEQAEVDRVLRPGGRLLVVHDYGRDDVSRLRGDAPEYGPWSRREGPFLRGGFKIRVIHCWWTFVSLEEAAAFLAEAFGPIGAAVAADLKRSRLSWNVAIYHRSRAAAAAG